MYLPQHFAQTRVEELHRVITENPLGVLVVQGPNELDANHLPFLLDPQAGEHGRLLAHVARANPVWQESKDGDAVLVIFRAANAYLSPNWYPSQHAFHRQVPTWNYQAVHVHGTISIRDDETFVPNLGARLTRVHEARTGSARPWKMTDSSPEHIDQILAAMVGIEIEIHKLVGKWKLSQNRDEQDRVNAAEELRLRGEQLPSAAMVDTLAGKNRE